MPEKFDLTYIGADGREHRPVMLHRTILGSLERFFGILIENFAGAFPYWIAPVQVRILPVSGDFVAYAKKVAGELRSSGVRLKWTKEMKNSARKSGMRRHRKSLYGGSGRKGVESEGWRPERTRRPWLHVPGQVKKSGGEFSPL